MLQWAGRGVAMGQAPVEVQEAADAVTATVQDDGAARSSTGWFGAVSRRRVRLVATDLDGTLLHTDGTVTDRTREVLDALDERGVTVVFVTGRRSGGWSRSGTTSATTASRSAATAASSTTSPAGRSSRPGRSRATSG